MAQTVRPIFVLKAFLWLIMVHSVGVGLSLIWHPATLLAYFGYAPCSEPFFPIQGGVFHIVMAVVLAFIYFHWYNSRLAKELEMEQS